MHSRNALMARFRTFISLISMISLGSQAWASQGSVALKAVPEVSVPASPTKTLSSAGENVVDAASKFRQRQILNEAVEELAKRLRQETTKQITEEAIRDLAEKEAVKVGAKSAAKIGLAEWLFAPLAVVLETLPLKSSAPASSLGLEVLAGLATKRAYDDLKITLPIYADALLYGITPDNPAFEPEHRLIVAEKKNCSERNWLERHFSYWNKRCAWCQVDHLAFHEQVRRFTETLPMLRPEELPAFALLPDWRWSKGTEEERAQELERFSFLTPARWKQVDEWRKWLEQVQSSGLQKAKPQTRNKIQTGIILTGYETREESENKIRDFVASHTSSSRAPNTVTKVPQAWNSINENGSSGEGTSGEGQPDKDDERDKAPDKVRLPFFGRDAAKKQFLADVDARMRGEGWKRLSEVGLVIPRPGMNLAVVHAEGRTLRLSRGRLTNDISGHGDIVMQIGDEAVPGETLVPASDGYPMIYISPQDAEALAEKRKTLGEPLRQANADEIQAIADEMKVKSLMIHPEIGALGFSPEIAAKIFLVTDIGGTLDKGLEFRPKPAEEAELLLERLARLRALFHLNVLMFSGGKSPFAYPKVDQISRVLFPDRDQWLAFMSKYKTSASDAKMSPEEKLEQFARMAVQHGAKELVIADDEFEYQLEPLREALLSNKELRKILLKSGLSRVTLILFKSSVFLSNQEGLPPGAEEMMLNRDRGPWQYEWWLQTVVTSNDPLPGVARIPLGDGLPEEAPGFYDRLSDFKR